MSAVEPTLYIFLYPEKIYWRKTNDNKICANSKQQTATKLICITALLAFGLIGCTTKKKDNSKALIGLLALNSLKAPSACDASVNVIAEPTSAGGSVTLKFKQSTINTTAYLGYITFTPTANRFFILDYTNSNVSKANFSTVLTNANCSDSSFTSVASLFNTYAAGDSLPSPYTANSLSSTDTKKIIYQTISSNSSTYTVPVTTSTSVSPTGITVTRASFGN